MSDAGEGMREYVIEKRIERCLYAMGKLQEHGIEFSSESSSTILIIHRGHTIRFYPYTGWYTGRGIKDGRGLRNLIQALTNPPAGDRRDD